MNKCGHFKSNALHQVEKLRNSINSKEVFENYTSESEKNRRYQSFEKKINWVDSILNSEKYTCIVARSLISFSWNAKLHHLASQSSTKMVLKHLTKCRVSTTKSKIRMSFIYSSDYHFAHLSVVFIFTLYWAHKAESNIRTSPITTAFYNDILLNVSNKPQNWKKCPPTHLVS